MTAVQAERPPTHPRSEPDCEYDPWDHLARMPEVTLAVDPDLKVSGTTCFSTATITLRGSLDVAEARSTLAHELIHLQRGSVSAGDCSAEEAVVELLAAANLFPSAALPSLPDLVAELGIDAVAEMFCCDTAMTSAAVRLARALGPLEVNLGYDGP